MIVTKNLKFTKLSPILLGLAFLFFFNNFYSQNAAVLDWVYQTYGTGNGLSQGIGDIIIDSDDNIYVSGGVASGTVDLDPDENNEYLITGDNTNGIGFIAKYSPNGYLIWAKEFQIGPWHMVIDDDGNLYTSGHFNIPIDFDPSPNEYIIEPSAREMYIAKYDNEGNFLWVKTTQTQGSSQTFVEDLAICSQTNRITVSGIFGGDVDVNPDENESNVLSSEAFHIAHAYIATYDLEGEFIWATDFYVMNVTSSDRIYLVDYDNDGGLYLCGHFADTVQLDPNNNIPPVISFSNESEENDVFIAKYDINNELQWISLIQGYSRNICRDISVFENHIYLSGHTNKDMTVYSSNKQDSIYIDDQQLPRPFIVKYNSQNGDVVWAFDLDVTDNSWGGTNFINVNQSGCYISGSFGGIKPVDFNPDPNTEHLMTNNSGNQEAFLAKYTSEGEFAWAFSTPGGVFTEPKGLQVLSDDRVVLAGSYRGNVDVSGYGSGDSISSYFTSSINYHVFMGVYKQGMLSTQEVSAEQEITLFPNPATNKQTIDLSGYEGKKVKITLYDIQGRSHGVVYDGKLNNQNQTVEFDVSHLSSGFYLYDVRLETERRALRFIKQ